MHLKKNVFLNITKWIVIFRLDMKYYILLYMIEILNMFLSQTNV